MNSFIEERADQSGVSSSGFSLERHDVYRRKSIWETPGLNFFNSSGNSILIIVSMRSLSADNQLFKYLVQSFPIKVHVYSKKYCLEARIFESLGNEVLIKGTPPFIGEHHNSFGYIQSPRYPHAYPATISQNFTIQNSNSSGFVRLQFDDYRINYRSLIQIVDGNEIVFDSRTTHNRRPGAIQSTGSVLHINFAANYFTNLVGFKARYSFVNDREWQDRPISE